MEIRRRINAWILLGLFIPLMMTASLHRHEVVGEQEELCESCVHHQAHSGHLASGVSCIVECVFCQFLTYHFLKAAVCSVVAFIALDRTIFMQQNRRRQPHLVTRCSTSRSGATSSYGDERLPVCLWKWTTWPTRRTKIISVDWNIRTSTLWRDVRECSIWEETWL